MKQGHDDYHPSSDRAIDELFVDGPVQTRPHGPARSFGSRAASLLELVQASLNPRSRRHRRAEKPTASLLKPFQVAQNPNTPARLLEFLATADDASVRWSVAGNLNTPARLLEGLAVDQNSDVRSGVARNPSTRETLLALLAADDSSHVREQVADNRNTPPGALALLADDTDATVRRCAARNWNTPIEALEPLLTADLPEVAVARGIIVGLPLEAQNLAMRLAVGWDGSLAELCETAGILADSDQPQSPAPSARVAEQPCGDPW